MKTKNANPSDLEALLSDKQKEIDALKKELSHLRSQTPNHNTPDNFVFSNFVFENTNDVMFLLKVNGKGKYNYLKVNKVFLKTLNIDESAAIGKSIQDILPLKDAIIAIENFNVAFKTKSQVLYEECIEIAGVISYYETTITPIIDSSSKVQYITGIARDITSKKVADLELKKSELKYKQLFDNVNDAIVIFEPNTEKVLEVNATACRIYGYSENEFLNMTLKDITKNIQKGEFYINETINQNKFINFETIQFDKQGNELLFLVNASVIEYNGIKAILSVNRNITDFRQAEIKAREAREQILNIANNFPNSAIYQYITDINNQIIEVTFMSEGAKNLFGYSPEELINNPSISYNAIHSADLAGFMEELAFSRIHNKNFEYTYRIKADGEIKWAHTRLKQTQLSNELRQYDGLTIDVTNNKIIELTLIESQRFLNTLINNLPGFAYRIRNNKSDSLEYISDGIYKLTGYDINLFKENPNFFAEIIHKDDKVNVFKAHKNAEINKSSYDNEYRIITKDKRIKWIWDRGESVLNQNGEIIAFEGFVTDITELKTSEQIVTEKSKELERQRTFYNNIIENLPVAVFVKNAKDDLKFTIWNKKAEEIYGYTKKELIGKNAFDIWEKEKADKYYLEDLEVSKKNRILELPDNFVELKSGENIYLNSKKVPLIESANGEVDYILCVSEDITISRRQAEAIKQNEALLNTLFEISPVPMFLSKLSDGTIIKANKNLIDLLEMPADEVIGQTTPNFYVNLEDRKNLLTKLIEDGRLDQYELKIQNSKKKEFDLLVSVEMILLNNESIVFTTFLDISGTKQQNKLLSESLSLLQTTLDSIQEGILAIDLNKNITVTNRKLFEIWDVTNDYVESFDNSNYLFEYIVDKVKDKATYIENTVELYTNLELSSLFRFELLNGKIIERYTIPQKIDNEIVGRVASFRDITESVNTFKALEESKALLEETNSLARVGGWELDLINNKLSWSQITKEIHEVPSDYEPDLATAINFYKEGFDREQISNAVDHGIKFAIPWDLELQIITGTGQHRWVRANGKPEFTGNICTRIYGTFQDIHDRKILDLALQESEEQHRILFDKNPLINITLDSEGIILAINEKGILELGFPKDEIIGNSFLQLFQNEKIKKVESFLNVCRNSIGRLYNLEIDSVTKFNEVIWLSISATSLKNSIDEVIISIVCENITKEREVESALLNSEANLRTVFESTDIGYILFDINANILTFNTPAYYFTIKQHKKELIKGKNLLDYIPEERIENIQNVIKKVLYGNKVEYETSDKTEFNETTWYEFVYSPVKSKDNLIVGIVMSMKDITQTKLIQNELNNTLLKVETTNNKLQEIIQQKDKFFSIIAHDLRSPFSGFIGLTQLITEEFQFLSNEELKSLTNELNKSANNLFKLLENLLEWSRIQRGMVKFNLEHISLYDKIQKNIDLLQSKADLKSIQIVNKVPFDSFIYADNQMIDVVIRNILANAVKFTNNGGLVEVFMRQSNNFIEVQIKDNGIGMPDEIISELFKIDSKSSRIGTANEPSTGLGLLLCKEYVEKHGGTIWAENNPDKGSSFYFTILNTPDLN